MTHILFNKAQTRRNRARAKQTIDTTRADFLLRRAEDELIDRLSDIKRTFEQTLVITPDAGEKFQTALAEKSNHLTIDTLSPLADQEILPHRPGKFDAIISVYHLHKINDLPGWLIQTRNALKEDGVFIGCLIGGDTLIELRQTLLQAELTTSGGASPRISPFISTQQAASLLQRAGFSLPVADSEQLTIAYRDIFHLMSDLRAMGESNCLTERMKHFTPSKLFAKTAQLYDTQYKDPTDGRITATFETIFMIGWSPSNTQQKPLPRGSGQVSLSSILEG